ncbi:histone acetyltransferase KAT6A-like [Homalodisca vitripennis]|uniref:histone acetyltransferase KAT6A-like n=1 Tax=Homalodisca vitripennis TaxID=197043 RepID=UPI001EEC57D4|nr:histone acetyltransferase KAT6A-like [Homalodisca vitripennis]
MSYSSNFRNVLGRNVSPSTGGNQRFQSNFVGNPHFQSNSSTMGSSAQPRTPMIYPQQFMTRNQLPESEPMSECSELAMAGVTRSPSTPLYRTMPQAGLPPPQQQRVNQMRGRDPPYKRPVSAYSLPPLSPRSLPPPSPRSLPSFTPHYLYPPPPPMFFPNYNPDQSFAMQTVASTSTSVVPVQNSTATKSSSGSKKTPSKPKISSVSRKRFFIGSIDQVVRWHKMAKEAQLHTIYEITAVLDSVSLSPTGLYRMILRSEQRNGTLPLQAIFYPIDRELPKINVGELITCVGQMVGSNKLQVYNMWQVTESLAGLKRVSFICQRTLHETHDTVTKS